MRHVPGAVAGALVAVGILVCGMSASAQRERTQPEERFRDPAAWLSLDELVERADTIVSGEVLDVGSAWTADRGQISTTITLRPDRRFKGGGQGVVRFRIPGGTGGDVRLMVTHSPVFAIGDKALVFLTGDGDRLPRVVGGEAGTRHIRIGQDGEEVLLPGFSLSEPGTGGRTGLSTLDELAGAMPRLLGTGQPR